MKKIIIELEDDTYTKLIDMTKTIRERYKVPELTPEQVAADLVIDAVKLDVKLKETQHTMSEMFGGLASDYSELPNPDELLSNLKELIGNMNPEVIQSMKDKKAKASKNTNNTQDDDEEEFEYKS